MVILMWAALVSSLVWDVLTGFPMEVLLAVAICGTIICTINTLLVWRRLLIKGLRYVVAVGMAVLSFTMMAYSTSFPNYEMLFFSMGLVSLYHDFRPLILSGLLGVVISGYLFLTDHPVLMGVGAPDFATLVLYLILMSGFLVAQTWIGEKNRKSLEEKEHVLLDANVRQQGMIATIGESAEQLAMSAAQLTEGANQSSLAVQHIAVTIEQLTAGSDKQVVSVDESARTIADISSAIHQVADNAQHVSVNATQTAELASEGDVAIQTVVHQMNSINSTMNELAEVVKGLGERSKEIDQIVEVITGISEQTNLLALNAAIEAARAGEHGRGFAVVADEVRKLAEQSGRSAQQIAQLVVSIRDETDTAVHSMEVVSKEVSDGLSIVNQAGQSFAMIRGSIDQVADQISGVSKKSQDMSIGTARVVELISRIEAIANESAAATENVSAATEEQLATMQEIVSSAAELSKLADNLRNLTVNE